MALTDDIAGAGALPWWQQAWPDGPPGMAPMPPPVTDELAGAPPAPSPVDAAPLLPFAAPPSGPEDQPLAIPPPVDVAPPLPYGAEPGAPPPTPAPAPVPDAITGGAAPGTPHDVALDQATPALPEEYKTYQEVGAELARDPYKAAAAQLDLDARRQDFEAKRQSEIDRADAQREANNYFNYQQAMQRSQAARDKLMADSDRLANTKTDRGRWYNGNDTIGRAGTFLAAIAGGLIAGTTGGDGHNHAMDWIDKQVNADVDAQQADIRNRGTELQRQQGLLQEQGAADLDAYHQAEVVRVAGYKRALGDLQTQAQQFDPRSTRALGYAKLMSDVSGRIQMAGDAYQKAQLDQEFKRAETMDKYASMAKSSAEIRKLNAETAKITSKSGAGGAAVPGAHGDYKVPLMLDDPFTHEPLFAKYSLGKEEDAARHKEAGTTIQEYKQLRSITNEMIQLAADGKGWDEVLTGGRTRTTKGERYDNLRNTAVSITAKLNDGKTGIGILVLNEKLIPERKTSLSLADTGELLRDFQRDGDERLASTLDTAGIDSSGILKHARQASQPAPSVDADERERVARENAASHPSDPDAQAELHSADYHASLAHATAENAQTLVNNFAKATPITRLAPRKEAGTGDEFSAVADANKNIENYNALLGKFHEEVADKSYLDGVDKKKAGDVQAAERRRTDQLRKLAADVGSSHSLAVDSLQRALDARKQTDAILRGGRPAQVPRGPNSALPDVPPELTLGPSQSMRSEQPKRKGKH